MTGESAVCDLRGYPDFLFVDVAIRPGLRSRTVTELAADPYLFKAVPLLYRTWIYHHLVGSRKIFSGKHDDAGMLRLVLAQKCIDAPLTGGRNSPMLCFVPLAMATCFTGRMSVVLIALAVLATLLAIAILTNTPSLYRHSRLISLPVRFAFFVFVCVSIASANTVELVGFLLTLGAAVADFLSGDVVALYSFRFHCSYEILQSLPNRVNLCYRHGAAFLEEKFGGRGLVPEKVTGMASDRHHHLIADIGDLILELRPLTEDDWQAIFERHIHGAEPEPIPYVNLEAVKIPSDTGGWQDNFSAKQMLVEDF